MARVVPPGYETLSEARRRAERKWDDDARGHLSGLVVTEQLQAYLVDEGGNPYPFPKEELPCVARLLRLSTARLNEMWAAPVFLKRDLDREIPDTHPYTIAGRRKQKLIEKAKHGQKEGSAQAAVAPKNKGGRPTEHDWRAIFVEMAAFIEREGIPDTYTKLAEFIEGWLLSTGQHSPARSELHKLAKQLIDRIRRERNVPPKT
jgi:hypothetical protein